MESRMKHKYNEYVEESINSIISEGRYRTFANITRSCGNYPHATLYHDDGSEQQITVWCSNDYLGMGQNKDILNSIKITLDSVGAGSGGTRNISGTTKEHVLLESEIAALHQKQAALLFTSGYVANDATLSTLSKIIPDLVMLSDENNHASMIEGIRHGGAPKMIFKHNDMADLEDKLRTLGSKKIK